MAHRPTWPLFVCAGVAIAVSACRPANAELQDHARKVRSLRATTTIAVNAWLSREASDRFTQATLDRVFQLLDEERHSVAGTPSDRARPAADALASEADRLSRLIAGLSHDVDARDAAAARRHLGALSSTGSEPR